MKTIFNYILEHFNFLETEYNFVFKSKIIDTWFVEVVFLNSSTGIRLVYERREQFLAVFIHKLVDGKMINCPSPLLPSSEITCFEMNDALPADRIMKPAYAYGEDSMLFDTDDGLSLYIKEFALRLHEYGQDVLNGDFSILPKMEKVIKARAIEFRGSQER